MDRDALKARYDAIFASVTPPFAFVDLDAMRRNAAAMLDQAGGLPIRVASKSVRSTAVLRRILELDPGFRGVLAFTVPEALHLRGQGFDDVVVAYPSVDRGAIAQVARLAAEDPGAAPVLMVDDRPHLDLIEGAIGGGPARVRVCLDIDVGWWPLGGRLARIGPKRSPVHDPARARRMADEIERAAGDRLAGLMAYEGQIAGVGDRIAGPAAAKRGDPGDAGAHPSARSAAACRDRRRGARGLAATGRARVRQRRRHRQPRPHRGGRDRHRADRRLGLLRPGAVRQLPLARARAGRVLLPAGRPAAGRRRRDAARRRLPRLRRGRARPAARALPARRAALRPPGGRRRGADARCCGAAAYELRVGDRVYLRHAKAGELCERFDSLYLVEGERIVDEVPTYRGEGKAFL